MYNEIIKIINLPIDDYNKQSRYFYKKLESEQIAIMSIKQKLYNYADDDNDKKKLATLKKDPAKFERAVLLLAIIYYRQSEKSEKLKAQIKNERLKNRGNKPNLLEDKIRAIFAEIQLYRRDGKNYVEITNILKKYHRTMFSRFKLTPSYVRRIILKLETEKQ